MFERIAKFHEFHNLYMLRKAREGDESRERKSAVSNSEKMISCVQFSVPSLDDAQFNFFHV